MKYFFASLGCILSLLLLETTIFTNLNFLPVIPDLLLIFTIYIGISRGSISGEIQGFASGFSLDFMSGAPLGLNALIRTILGFLAGLFHLNVNTNGFLIPAFFGIIGTIVKAILLEITSFFFPSIINSYALFSSDLFYECILNALFSPILFHFFSLFSVFAGKINMEK